jgi:hypothetical protein
VAPGIVLGNEAIAITLDDATGAITQIVNRERELNLVAVPGDGIPWRVELQVDGASTWVSSFTRFDWDRDEAEGRLDLRWETDHGIRVRATVGVTTESGVAFRVAVDADPGVVIDKVEYPRVTGVGDLHPIADSVLVHSQSTGFLFRRPLDLFETTPRRDGLRYSPYPEAYNGSTTQLWTYYAEGIGGFLLRAEDPDCALKWLNVFKVADGGSLECSVMHQQPDIRPGNAFEVPYPIVVETTVEGTWYEAAERYKTWAVRQPWASRGRLADREDRPGWLLDEVGFATFGVNAAADRSAWLDRFHGITDEPVFHILGVNWPKWTTGYGRSHPGGRDDWFPAQFSEANLETIRRNGDRWAAFEFDLLLDEGRSESEAIVANRSVLPPERYSFDHYPFWLQCPAAPYIGPLHEWRDATLSRDYEVDALYYDISCPNRLPGCRDASHGHPVGGGAWMIAAEQQMYGRTRVAASAARGAYVAQGTELAHEGFVGTLDYYQARAEASPCSIFEADFFRDWIVDGRAEKVPLFAFIYHEYGPVRLDGWAKLSKETGDLFYWVGARVGLWGGLFELNYEFSDLEALEGFSDHPDEHYADLIPRAYEVDPGKVAFTRELARARTGFGNPWLVYGEMLRPLDLAAEPIELDYHLYNLHEGHVAHDFKGTMTVDDLIHATWRAPDGRIGFAFVNLRPDGDRTLPLTIDPATYGIPAGMPVTFTRLTSDGRAELHAATGAVAINATLPARRVVIVEMTLSQSSET